MICFTAHCTMRSFTVAMREGPELPQLAGLGYQLSSGWARHIDTLPQFLPQSFEILGFPKLPDMLDGDPVDARRSLALVCGNRSPSTPQVAAIGNPAPQLTVLPFGILPTPLIEFSLHAE